MGLVSYSIKSSVYLQKSRSYSLTRLVHEIFHDSFIRICLTWSMFNIVAEPATITERPLEEMKAAEGKDIMLTCAVFGSPPPLVVWKKGSEQLTGGRFRVTDEGHLEIKDVSLVDAGTYTCTASNQHGSDTATGVLIVRRE